MWADTKVHDQYEKHNWGGNTEKTNWGWIVNKYGGVGGNEWAKTKEMTKNILLGESWWESQEERIEKFKEQKAA